MKTLDVSRRGFLKAGAAGGAFLLGFSLPGRSESGHARAAGPPYAPHAFLRISPDDTVTIVVNKSEMGQGVYTSIPMLVAEELECDWNRVRVEAAPVDPIYNNPALGSQTTGGSTSTKTEWERMRQVGAAARQMLVAAAAATWGVDEASCRAENGRVVHAGGRALTYGELAERAARLPVPERVVLKDRSAYRLVGKPTPRLDSPAKVDGSARFGIDVSFPGMLVALLARPPVFGATVEGFDAAKTKEVPGVKEVVAVDAGVAVVADSFWAAEEGRKALRVRWKEGPGAGVSTQGLRERYAELAREPGETARRDGDPDRAYAEAAKRVTADYEVPYLAHACMEPLNCAVDWKPGSCDVWVGTQAQTLHRSAAARAAGLPPEQVRLHTTYLGGGFGRRGNPHADFVVPAVQVAKAVGRPVKLLWTRGDDTRGGFYRPLWLDRLSGGLDADGNLVAWRHTVVGQSIMHGTAYESVLAKGGIDAASVEGASDLPYDIPNLFVGLASPVVEVPVQWWRSVGHSHTCFAVEGFVDELAAAAGRDPYAFRQALLAKKPRHRNVLELAAKRAGWGLPLPPGRGRGIAFSEAYGSLVAEVAEVSVAPDGEPRVHRVVCVIDCGQVVNPSTVEAQMESSVVFGLSAALYGAITLREGRVEQANFDDYPILRMDRMPTIDVEIVPSTEDPGGVGEPATAIIAPAVTNALFAATGARVRRLPLRLADLKEGRTP